MKMIEKKKKTNKTTVYNNFDFIINTFFDI